jgi:hypothetical protein
VTHSKRIFAPPDAEFRTSTFQNDVISSLLILLLFLIHFHQMAPILRSRRCSARLLVASATNNIKRYQPIDFRTKQHFRVKGSTKQPLEAAKPGKCTYFSSQPCCLTTLSPFTDDAAIAEAIIQPPLQVPIQIPRIPIIPPMAPPAMINTAIEHTTPTDNTTAVEPALAPADDLTLAAIGPTTIHPIEPIPRSLPHPICTLKPNRRPKPSSKPDYHTLKQRPTNPNSWFCYTPERQIIPNAIVPSHMPKGISEFNYLNNKNNRNAFFQVCHDNICIRYTYGANGYTRANAYNEAARCLRYFLIRKISKLDETMHINNIFSIDDMHDALETLLSDDDGLGIPMERTLSLATTNSATTSSCIIYDEDDNIDIDFSTYDNLPYESNTTSSMDVQPLIVNFDDDDLNIEI